MTESNMKLCCNFFFVAVVLIISQQSNFMFSYRIFFKGNEIPTLTFSYKFFSILQSLKTNFWLLKFIITTKKVKLLFLKKIVNFPFRKLTLLKGKIINCFRFCYQEVGIIIKIRLVSFQTLLFTYRKITIRLKNFYKNLAILYVAI